MAVKFTDYPLVHAFLNGAASNNSGGSHDGIIPKWMGTAKEFGKAEGELQDMLRVYGPANEQRAQANMLGGLADEGYTVSACTSEEDDEPHKLMAYTILDRGY